MKKLALGALFAGLLAACGGGGNNNSKTIVLPDSSTDAQSLMCNVLMQTGCQANEKCSWIIDATTPMYVGHVGCVPDGTAAVGGACMFGAAGATGYDDCSKGGVCSAFGTPGTAGVCKAVCDNAGGNPMCDASHVCVTYSRLFSTGATSPAAAGVCDLACDPLKDNDFDGSGSQTKTQNTCGSATNIGCYGVPSRGTPPATGWSCTGDVNSTNATRLVHRVHCDTTTGCADTDGTIYVNSCNQGYLPLFRESTAVTTAVCIALCAPLPCYKGNCGGTTNPNRLGAAPHRCQTPDAQGTFNSTPAHEECEYLWSEEIDGSNNWLPSPTSDTVGFCFDHHMYPYDPAGGTNYNTYLPGCEDLDIVGSGSDPAMPLTYFGAENLGCVNSALVFGSGSAHGKRVAPFKGVNIDRPRMLYHRVMEAN